MHKQTSMAVALQAAGVAVSKSGIRAADVANVPPANVAAGKAKQGKVSNTPAAFATLPVFAEAVKPEQFEDFSAVNAEILAAERIAITDDGCSALETVLHDHLSDPQCDAVQDIIALALSRAIDLQTIEERGTVAFPIAMEWADWQPITHAVRLYVGPGPAMALRNAYRSAPRIVAREAGDAKWREVELRDLPEAGTGSGNGRKGMSATRCAKGLHARVDDLATYLADTLEACKDKLHAGHLADVAAAIGALRKAEAAFNAAPKKAA